MLPRTLRGVRQLPQRRRPVALSRYTYYSSAFIVADTTQIGHGCVNGPGHLLSDRFGHENLRAQLNDDS